MFGQLPNLFGKAFAIGFFLPATAIALAAAGVLAIFGDLTVLLKLAEDEKALGTTLALAVVWLASIVLMALNHSILRFLEGYGAFNPLQVFLPIQVEQFQSLTGEAARLKERIDEAKARGREPDQEAVIARARLLMTIAAEFPDKPAWLLPTRLGNIIRAFEVYPRVIYGLEGIQGWSRLSAVVSQDYLRTIEEAKAQLDFWANLCIGGVGIALLYWALAARAGDCPDWWVSLAALGVCLTTYRAACGAAMSWGALVMSAFDLYRIELCRKVGLEMPRSTAQEREMWAAFSQTTVYRSSTSADKLMKFRPFDLDD